jgi:hypothetical protein
LALILKANFLNLNKNGLFLNISNLALILKANFLNLNKNGLFLNISNLALILKAKFNKLIFEEISLKNLQKKRFPIWP